MCLTKTKNGQRIVVFSVPNESKIKEMLNFYESELNKPTLRGDCYELIELSLMFFED